MSERTTIPGGSGPDGGGPAGRGTWGPAVLALLSLAWLGAVLWLARGAVAGAAGTGNLAVSAAALVLPSVVTASLVGGAAAGLLVTALWAGRRDRPGRGTRVGLGVGAGTLAGLVAGGLILAAYGGRTSIVVLAGTVAVAGLLGGLAGGVPPRAPVAAGLAATLSAIAAGFLLEIARPALKQLLGAGDTVASQVDATTRLTYLTSLVAAVIAGLVGYWYQHRAEPAARWPRYLLAGACPGLLLLVAEVLTRTGGARLLDIAKALSPADRVSLDYLSGTRVNHALIVLFAGAITTIVLHGRTLSAPADPSDAAGEAGGRAGGTDEAGGRAGGTGGAGASSPATGGGGAASPAAGTPPVPPSGTSPSGADAATTGADPHGAGPADAEPADVDSYDAWDEQAAGRRER